MLLPTAHLPAFLVTVYVVILIPGPSVLFIISRGVSLGRRAAFVSAVGNETGLTLQLLLVAVGVGSIQRAAPKSLRRTWREGFFVGATNPKGILIFTAILPQFIDRSQGHLTAQLLTLGLICVLIALLSDGVWALLSGTARSWLGRSPRRLELMSGTGGVMLIGLGVGLAVTGRPK